MREFPVHRSLDTAWTQDAPTTWERTYLGHVVDVLGGATPSKDEPSYWDGEVPWVSPKDMKVLRIFDSEDHVSASALAGSALRGIAPGSVLMVTRGMILDHTVPIALAMRPLTINQDMKALVPRSGLHGDFLSWLLVGLNPAILARVEEAAHGTKALRTEQWKKLPLAVPPEPDQRRIADFLDRKTAALDALIAKKERLVALLAEKRQALITQAVTKGLDPSVPMKDSGVDWIGQVPAHWKIKMLKRDSIVRRGASPRPIDDPKYFDEAGDYGWVRISDVTESDGFLLVTEQRLSDVGANLSVKLAPGSLFLSIAGSVGKACIAGINCCIHDGFVYFPELSAEPAFLKYIFDSGQAFGGLGKFGTQLNLNTEIVGSIQVPFPARDEQKRIVEYIRQELRRLDGVSTRITDQLARLREYRQALITAAVTGQLDVSGEARG